MLVLARRVGEKLTIGDNVKVTVVRIKGGEIRLSIEAPLDIKVHREEVYQRILKEKPALNGSRVACALT